MSTNFEIYDKKLVNMINESDQVSSQESTEWEEMEHTDEIETWCSQVETADQIKKENIENPQISNKTFQSSIPEQIDYDRQSRQEMLDFVKHQRSENTRLKTEGDMRRFIGFLRTKGEKRRPVDIPPVTLDGHIGHFIMDLHKQDGSPYEPGTITGFHRYIFLPYRKSHRFI